MATRGAFLTVQKSLPSTWKPKLDPSTGFYLHLCLVAVFPWTIQTTLKADCIVDEKRDAIVCEANA